MRSLLLLTGIIFLILAPRPDTTLSAQQDAVTTHDSSDLVEFSLFPGEDPFQTGRIIKISLKFDMRSFIRTKHKGEYMPAELTIYNLDPDTLIKEIQIRARGISRRSICHLPPIKLNFKDTNSDPDSLNDINSLKLVTHCKNSATYEKYVLKEYLVYRMYNLLTDSSFRVKLLQIEYVDSEDRKKPVTRYGFMIESNNQLGERLQGIGIDREGINTWDTDTYHTNLTAVFQYMIGNTDWSIPVLHNFKLVKPYSPTSNLLAIPYDFDYSVMVNTSYAIPDEKLGTESVLIRVYRGYCLPSDEHYQSLFKVFIRKKRDMFSLIEDFDLLDEKSKEEMRDYLDEFYHIIENPLLAKREIINSCRPLPFAR